ncbi:hypothetical protein F4679DRAFT_32095 [Xylaria curta]|nr:hypothetical protein F4679DRAFT_32095 [Xylaria curta]
MAPPTKRFPPNQWLQRKATIRELYLTEKRSLDDIVQLLACDDFHPNKHQVEHKVKTWGFNKNVPKSLAEATWRYIGYEIANRQSQGKDTEVVLFGQVQDKRKVETEIRRYYRFRYGGEPIPKPPEGVDILLRTSSYQKPMPWPLSLPWLQFQSRDMAGLPLRFSSIRSPQQGGYLIGNYTLTAMSTIYHTNEFPMSISESSFASLLKTTMPELYPGEATNRAKIILRGWSKQALEEQIMIFLFHLSNKALRDELDWELIIDMVERSGIMSAPIIINDISTTILAVRETLFELSFKAILRPRAYNIVDINTAMPRILRLIKWLLKSGQPSDTYIAHYFMIDMRRITPLQIAAWKNSKDLLATLLKNGANPNLVLRQPGSVVAWLCGSYLKKWAMPPLFLAALSAHQYDDLSCLDLLLSSGATIYYHHSPKYGFLSKATFLTLLAGKKEEGIALDIIKMLTTRPIGIAYLEAARSDDAANIAISAASRGNIEVLKFLRNNDYGVARANRFGLTALHAAAYEGHVECCKFLLKCGLNANYYNSAFPSPIHLACYRNHIEVVKFLHEQGACINQKLSTPSRLHELAFKRYFCKDRLSIGPTNVPFQSLIGTVLSLGPERPDDIHPPFACPEDNSLAPLVSYLLHHGATLPSFAVSRAAYLRDMKLLSVVLAAGADPNSPGLEGRTPLHFAFDFKTSNFYKYPLEHGEMIQIGKMLLDAGAEATRSDAVRAMRSGDRDLVMKILGHTLVGQPSREPYENTTLLEAALLSGDSFIIQQVLKRDSITYSPGALCAATLQAVKTITDPDMVYQLLQYRNPDSTSQECLILETTAVGIAACYQCLGILGHLLDHIPVSNAARIPPNTGKIPMKQAIEQASSRYQNPFWYKADSCSVMTYALESNTNVMSKLLNHGYRLDWMAVTYMARFKNEEQFMKIILGQPILSHDRADPNIALSSAILSGDNSRVQFLLQVCKAAGGGKLRLGGNNGPLQVAIEIGNTEIFDTLLEAGIDPGAPAEENRGMTALQAAAIYNRVGLAKRLIDLKVDVNAPGATHKGRTALEGAAEHGHIDLIRLLLDSGVETNGSDQLQYLRAIGLALLNGHHVAADLIKSHRKLTEEELSTLEGKHLLVKLELRDYRIYPGCDFSSDGVSSSESEDGDEGGVCDEGVTVQRDRVEDESSLADRSEGIVYGDLTAIPAKSPIFSQDGNNQAIQVSRDETLLSYDDETNEHTLEISNDDIQLRQEPSSALDTAAPSEGIYDFDYPLFDIYNMGDPIGEGP